MPFPRKEEALLAGLLINIPIEIAADETELEIAEIIWPDLNVGLHLHIEVVLIP